MLYDGTIIRVVNKRHYNGGAVSVKVIDRWAFNCGSDWHDHKNVVHAFNAAMKECGLIRVSDNCRVQVLNSWTETDVERELYFQDGMYETIEELLAIELGGSDA